MCWLMPTVSTHRFAWRYRVFSTPVIIVGAHPIDCFAGVQQDEELSPIQPLSPPA
jgi:hypothetical protein